MNWFYAQNGQQVGPVDEGELDGLVQRGTITPGTLVWHAGMANWQPFAQARPAGSSALAAVGAGASAGYSGVGGGGYVGAGQARCTECGQIFPEDEVVRLGAATVCARCKPLAVQKLREGVPLTNELPYAGFWIRFAAVFFDILIVAPIYVLLGVTVAFLIPHQAYSSEGTDVGGILIQLFVQLLTIVLNAAYGTFFVGRYGATPGKMICNLRVVRPDNTRLTYARALGRHFARMLSGFTLGIGYLIAAIDGEKRALHDYVCDTRVVYKG